MVVAVRARLTKDVSVEDYLLSGRNLRWYSIAASTIATNLHAGHFLAVIGSAYAFGLAQANFELNAIFGLLLAAFVFVPMYLRARVVTITQFFEQRFGLELEWLSGINSSGLELISTGRMPERVNHARIGEAIVLGRETTQHRPWPGTWQDAFMLYAEVLELKRKPSMPQGERGEDAFGRRPRFEDRGEMLRVLLNVGREDVDVSGITPLDRRLTVLGASSGYLVVDATPAEGDIQVGDTLTFSLNYSALLTAMTSEYVSKHVLEKSASAAGEG